MSAQRKINVQSAQGFNVGAQRRNTDDDDVKALLILVDFPDLRPLHQRGYGSADLPVRQSQPAGHVRAQADLGLRNENLRFDLEIDDARHVGDRMLDLFALGPQHVQVGAERAHHDRGACTGEHFLDAFFQVRQHVAIQSGITAHGFLDLRHGLGKVDVRIDADPQLGEIGPHDFISDFGPADVRAEVTHAGNGPQFFAGADRDTAHRFERGAWLENPVHEEIGFLEIRQEFLAQLRGGDRGGNQCADDDGHGHCRPSNDARQHAGVAALQPARQRALQDASRAPGSEASTTERA